MYLDLVQILMISCAITALQGGLMVVVWLQDRSAAPLLWKSAVFILGGSFLFLFLLDGPSQRPISIGLGTGAFIAATFACWASARAFEGRSVPLLPLAGVESVWLLVYFVPHAIDNPAIGVATQSLAGAGFVGAAAYEHWRMRTSPRLAYRWGLMVLYAVVGLFFALRMPFITMLPFPFGARVIEPAWIASYVLGFAVAAIVLAFLSIMLTKERAENELRAFALTDALTGLLNRRAFALDAARVARKHLRSTTGYCLVMFDLDHFKDVNDRYGHDYGDAVLRSFATIAQGSLPNRDAVYRLGGEEFCCLLSETDRDTAARIADRLRVSFRSTPVVHRGHGVEVSVSAGVASSLDAGTDPAQLQALADKALYRAKNLGRDRVCSGAHDNPHDADVHWAA